VRLGRRRRRRRTVVRAQTAVIPSTAIRFLSKRWGPAVLASHRHRGFDQVRRLKEEAERKYGGFPDLLAPGKVDLPATRSGEPGAQGLPFALLCFGTAWSLF